MIVNPYEGGRVEVWPTVVSLVRPKDANRGSGEVIMHGGIST